MPSLKTPATRPLPNPGVLVVPLLVFPVLGVEEPTVQDR